MNIQPYVDRLNANAPSLAQAVAANPGVTSFGIVSTDELVNVFSNVLADRVYQMVLPEYPTYPNMVYQLVSSTPQVVDGYHLTQVDTLVLYVRENSIDALDAAVAEVQAAIEVSAWSIEVQDMMYDYDDDQNVYRANIQITFTYPALAIQSLPAALVYPVGTSAQDSAYANRVRQRVSQTFAVTIISDSTSINVLRQNVFDALLGYQASVEHEPVQYQHGVALDGGGGLLLWQETYADGVYIEQV